MPTTRTLLSDRTGLLAAGGGLIAGMPPWAAFIYLLLRVIIPVLLIVVATRGASPAQKIEVVGVYLLGQEPPKGLDVVSQPADHGACCDRKESGPDPSLEP